MDYGPMRAALLGTYGESVTVTVGGVGKPLTVAFLAPYVGDDLRGVAINRPNPQAIADQAAWNTTGAKNNDTVTRAGTVYTVVDAQPTDDGFTTVTLRKYA